MSYTPSLLLPTILACNLDSGCIEDVLDRVLGMRTDIDTCQHMYLVNQSDVLQLLFEQLMGIQII